MIMRKGRHGRWPKAKHRPRQMPSASVQNSQILLMDEDRRF